MHWRGDRTGGNRAILDEDAGPTEQPNGGSFHEDIAVRKFNLAFVGLNGRHEVIPEANMQKFTDFILEVTSPPNPIRNLDNSLTPKQRAGRDVSFGDKSDTFFNCHGCHVLDRDGNREFPEVKRPGVFGTDGQFTFEDGSQFFKVPHRRNLYQKVGMFGMAPALPSVSRPFDPLQLALQERAFIVPLANNGPMGPQVRGFGFLHDGSVDTLFRLVSASTFLPRAPGTIPSLDPRTPPEMVPDPGNVGGLPLTPEGIAQRRALEAFMLAFDSNLAPIVGQQTTLTEGNAAVAGPRIDLLMARANAHECDLVAKNRGGGFLSLGDGQFRFSRLGTPAVPDRLLRATALLPMGEITYTCVPPGSGTRMGLDRDEDGVFDGDDHETRRQHGVGR
jgi:hypothetical protein